MSPKFISQRGKQGIALTLSFCLLWTSGELAEAALSAPQILAHSTRPLQLELAPPAALGRIVDSFNATDGVTSSGLRVPGSENSKQETRNSKLVILIQDLHAHYGVQKNIAGILEFLTKRLGRHSRESGNPETSTLLDPGLRHAGVTDNKLPFALAVEGASGPIDSSIMALFPDQTIKQEACDYLMREGELTGAEYFGVMRGLPQALTGVEDLRYYTIHRDLFRKTLTGRQQLVQTLTGIQADILPLKNKVYSRPLINIQEKTTAFDQGKFSIDEYLGYLASLANAYTLPLKTGYPALAQYLENPRAVEEVQIEYVLHEAHQLAFRFELAEAQSQQEKDLVQVDQDLALLLRVADLQATELEVRDFAPRLNQFLALATSLLASSELRAQGSGNLSHQGVPSPQPRAQSTQFDEIKLRQLISSSIDYYVMALMRNKPIVENTLRLLGADGSGLSTPSMPSVIARRADLCSHKRGPTRQSQKLKAAIATLKLSQKTKDAFARNDVVGAFPSQEPRAQSTVVLVAGGFHTTPITAILREKNISYLVITPAVDQITAADHALYVKRLSGQLLTEEEILGTVQTKRYVSPFGPSRRFFSKLLHPQEHSEGLAVGLFGLALAPHFLNFAVGQWMMQHHVDWATAVAGVVALILPRLAGSARSTFIDWHMARGQAYRGSSGRTPDGLNAASPLPGGRQAPPPTLTQLKTYAKGSDFYVDPLYASFLKDQVQEMLERLDQGKVIKKIQDDKGSIFQMIRGKLNDAGMTPPQLDEKAAQIQRAIELYYAPEHENEDLLKPGFVDSHGEQTAEQRAAREPVVEFIRAGLLMVEKKLAEDLRINAEREAQAGENDKPKPPSQLALGEAFRLLRAIADQGKAIEIAGWAIDEAWKIAALDHVMPNADPRNLPRVLKKMMHFLYNLNHLPKDVLTEDSLPGSKPPPAAAGNENDPQRLGKPTSEELLGPHMDRFIEILIKMFPNLYDADNAIRLYFNIYLAAQNTPVVSSTEAEVLLRNINAARAKNGESPLLKTTGSFQSILKVHRAFMEFDQELIEGGIIREIDKTTNAAIYHLFIARRKAENAKEESVKELPAYNQIQDSGKKDDASDQPSVVSPTTAPAIHKESESSSQRTVLRKRARIASEKQQFIIGKLDYLQRKMKSGTSSYGGFYKSLASILNAPTRDLLVRGIEGSGLADNPPFEVFLNLQPFTSLVACALYILDSTRTGGEFNESVMTKLEETIRTYNSIREYRSSTGPLSVPLLFSFAVSGFAEDESNLLRLVKNLIRLPGSMRDNVLAFHLLQQAMHHGDYYGKEGEKIDLLIIERLVDAGLKRIRENKRDATEKKLKIAVVRGLLSFTHTYTDRSQSIASVFIKNDPEKIIAWMEEMKVKEIRSPVPISGFMFSMGTDVLRFNSKLPYPIDQILLNPWDEVGVKYLRRVLRLQAEEYRSSDEYDTAVGFNIKTNRYESPENVRKIYDTAIRALQEAIKKKIAVPPTNDSGGSELPPSTRSAAGADQAPRTPEMSLQAKYEQLMQRILGTKEVLYAVNPAGENRPTQTLPELDLPRIDSVRVLAEKLLRAAVNEAALAHSGVTNRTDLIQIRFRDDDVALIASKLENQTNVFDTDVTRAYDEARHLAPRILADYEAPLRYSLNWNKLSKLERQDKIFDLEKDIYKTLALRGPHLTKVPPLLNSAGWLIGIYFSGAGLAITLLITLWMHRDHLRRWFHALNNAADEKSSFHNRLAMRILLGFVFGASVGVPAAWLARPYLSTISFSFSFDPILTAYVAILVAVAAGFLYVLHGMFSPWLQEGVRIDQMNQTDPAEFKDYISILRSLESGNDINIVFNAKLSGAEMAQKLNALDLGMQFDEDLAVYYDVLRSRNDIVNPRTGKIFLPYLIRAAEQLVQDHDQNNSTSVQKTRGSTRKVLPMLAFAALLSFVAGGRTQAQTNQNKAISKKPVISTPVTSQKSGIPYQRSSDLGVDMYQAPDAPPPPASPFPEDKPAEQTIGHPTPVDASPDTTDTETPITPKTPNITVPQSLAEQQKEYRSFTNKTISPYPIPHEIPAEFEPYIKSLPPLIQAGMRVLYNDVPDIALPILKEKPPMSLLQPGEAPHPLKSDTKSTRRLFIKDSSGKYGPEQNEIRDAMSAIDIAREYAAGLKPPETRSAWSFKHLFDNFRYYQKPDENIIKEGAALDLPIYVAGDRVAEAHNKLYGTVYTDDLSVELQSDYPHHARIIQARNSYLSEHNAFKIWWLTFVGMIGLSMFGGLYLIYRFLKDLGGHRGRSFTAADERQWERKGLTGPSSYALTGRYGKNRLAGKTLLEKMTLKELEANNFKLLENIDSKEIDHLKNAAKRQGLTFTLVEDPDGAFMRRDGNVIFINSLRSHMGSRRVLTALIHEIEGHDWEFVDEVLGASLSAENKLIISEAFAMFIAEFRPIEDPIKRFEAVFRGFRTRAILEDSSIDGKTTVAQAIEKTSRLDREMILDGVNKLVAAAALRDVPIDEATQQALDRMPGDKSENIGRKIYSKDTLEKLAKANAAAFVNDKWVIGVQPAAAKPLPQGTNQTETTSIASDIDTASHGDKEAIERLKTHGYRVFFVRKDAVSPDTAGRVIKSLARKIGFGSEIVEALANISDVDREDWKQPVDEAIETAVTELVTNIYEHAKPNLEGVVLAREIKIDDQLGIEIMARDLGPGLPNIEQAMEPGWSTAARIKGLGLTAARDFMVAGGKGSFSIESRGIRATYLSTGKPELSQSSIARGTLITARRFLAANFSSRIPPAFTPSRVEMKTKDIEPDSLRHAAASLSNNASGETQKTGFGLLSGFNRFEAGSIARARGNGDWVIKRLRRIPWANRGYTEVYSMEARTELANKIVELTNRLRDSLPEQWRHVIPETHSPRPAIIIQKQVPGFTLKELQKESARQQAYEQAIYQINQLKAAAEQALPGVPWRDRKQDGDLFTLDNNLDGFRFDEQGNIIAWFDPIVIEDEELPAFFGVNRTSRGEYNQSIARREEAASKKQRVDGVKENEKQFLADQRSKISVLVPIYKVLNRELGKNEKFANVKEMLSELIRIIRMNNKEDRLWTIEDFVGAHNRVSQNYKGFPEMLNSLISNTEGVSPELKRANDAFIPALQEIVNAWTQRLGGNIEDQRPPEVSDSKSSLKTPLAALVVGHGFFAFFGSQIASHPEAVAGVVAAIALPSVVIGFMKLQRWQAQRQEEHARQINLLQNLGPIASEQRAAEVPPLIDHSVLLEVTPTLVQNNVSFIQERKNATQSLLIRAKEAVNGAA